ncbi:TauD/TfdA family dioxygenase [Saccharibacter sp. 17.LH.SD]|uniref:TauD/TfdA dioxygenase family protein n=1 Tax=Saccharibacter sp. 17.LH.SD TaxID=2689393 RepID=UPI001371BF92|nr:TauD/TfdA family dioxygenase [Saccharibacter sp. 17.LH.SD]MXV44693.1 TauD/TfdA family dioxygenase [Saccharibacter sp. 17.LH.SD]
MSNTTSASLNTTSTLYIQRVSGALGAEVKGIRLSEDLSVNVISAIEEAAYKHKVLFFRNQNHLNDSSQERFAARFGNLISHPTIPHETNTQAVFAVDSKQGGTADSWHADFTFIPNYPKFSILRAVIIPEVGGSTLWANTAKAYATLPSALKLFANALWGIHSNIYDYATHHVSISEKEKHYRKIFRSSIYRTLHPFVRVHPVTGEHSLLLGHFLNYFESISLADSRKIIDLFNTHATQVENTIRWNWQPGDVALWDNQTTIHRAVNDFGNAERVLRRSTIEGDIPTSLDGRQSQALLP